MHAKKYLDYIQPAQPLATPSSCRHHIFLPIPSTLFIYSPFSPINSDPIHMGASHPLEQENSTSSHNPRKGKLLFLCWFE